MKAGTVPLIVVSSTLDTVELRDDVAGFLMGIAHLFDGVQDVPPWGDPHITHLVKKYADQYFGPAPD